MVAVFIAAGYSITVLHCAALVGYRLYVIAVCHVNLQRPKTRSSGNLLFICNWLEGRQRFADCISCCKAQQDKLDGISM